MAADLGPAKCAIALQGLQILADIDAHHHEIGRPQSFVIHVRPTTTIPRNDSLEEAYDYANVKDIPNALALERIVPMQIFGHRLASVARTTRQC